MMAILQQGSIEDRKRLLELFPVANLRQVFESKGTKKEEICYTAAASNDAAHIKRVAESVDNHFSRCKQHVYVFSHEEEWVRTGKAKQPYCFEVNDGELFAFAGIWDRCAKVLRSPGGTPIAA